jgi:hypothetical protein
VPHETNSERFSGRYREVRAFDVLESHAVAERHVRARGQRARRTPLSCQRVAGGKKFRYEARECPRGVAHEPPRSTICPHMNFALYSPSAPSSGTKPGYDAYALEAVVVGLERRAERNGLRAHRE